LTASVATRAPVTVGVKLTLTVHDEPAAIERPQPLLAMVKSDAADPLTDTVGVLATLPELRTVTAWAAPVLPRICSPKSSAVGVAARAGRGGLAPVPDRA